MAPRLQLQSLLSEITENVYFQPPNNVQMQYPCIVYMRDGSYVKFADNEMAMRIFFNIRYVEWRGVRWTVSNVEIYAPRLTMYLGKVYNGPTAPASIAPQ